MAKPNMEANMFLLPIVREEEKRPDYDPMAQEYMSKANAYKVANSVFVDDDLGEKRVPICRWYRENRECYRGAACPNLHIYTGQHG